MRKKVPETSTENQIDILVSAIKRELDLLEKPILFSFGKSQTEFKYANYHSSYYTKQDFNFAKERIEHAFSLIKNALISIKDLLRKFGIDNTIVIEKISELLLLEQSAQDKIRLEEIEFQKVRSSILFITFTGEKLFQEMSKGIFLFISTTKENLINFIERNFTNFDTKNFIANMLKEKRIQLPEELSNFKSNISGYVAVYYLENFFRIIIALILKEKPAKEIMPDDLLKKIDEAKKNEQINKWCDERYGGDLFYLNLSDLIKIAEYKKSYFINAGIKIEKVKSEIEKINTIRNKLAHNNTITDEEVNLLETNSKLVYNYCKDFHDDIASYKFKLKNTKLKDTK